MAGLLSSSLTNGMPRSEWGVWFVTYRGVLTNGLGNYLFVRGFGTSPEVSPYFFNDNMDIL